MRKSLRGDGTIFIEALNSRDLTWRALNPSVGGPGDVDMLYALADLKADFSTMIDVFSNIQTIDLAEGIYHKGKGSVVRAIFRNA